MENQIETAVIKPKMAIFDKENEYRLISTQDELDLDKGIQDLDDYLNNNHGLGKTEEEKDELYGKAKELWGAYAKTLIDTKYTFYLNRKQYKFLSNLLRDQLEYDVNTIFLAIELTEMLSEWYNTQKPKNDDEVTGFLSTPTDVTYMYHLIAKHKVKGLTADTYHFAKVLRKFGEISKIIQYYDNLSKVYSKTITDWVGSFEGVNQEPVKLQRAEEV